MTSDQKSCEKIGFAVVGCGRIAQSHFGAIARHADRAELLDVCDTNPAALDAAVKATGARGFDSLTALLSDTEAQCLVLATPSGLHSRQTIEIAESGRHIMTEKPMATRWQDGLAMVK